MFFKIFCLSKNISSILNLIDGNEIELINYRNNLYSLYKKYKIHKIYCYSLRLLQAIAGLGITTMTTVNNPYFKDNINQIQCVVSKNDIPFGSTQEPKLCDYADGIDTIEFLKNC